ncbi:MAG: HNH endonuclease [Magnetococcales bacterium]|nr:HNH endonuclease [Magnetococcales bacterium]
MLTLDMPKHTASDTFTTCISRISNSVLKLRLKAAIQTILDESKAFENAAKHHMLHKIIAQAIVTPDITTEEMKKVYTDRMAKANSPGRSIYDDIIGAAPQGRCPLCGQRTVSTLDHVLPKAHYPVLAVTPSNLVPACMDCNKAKLATLPQRAEEVALHPYYDDLGRDRWLFAEVIQTHPTALRYKIIPPVSWDNILTARVENHFRSLGLRRFYSSQSAVELSNIVYQLRRIHYYSGSQEVKKYLIESADSRENSNTNSWQTAAYRAWAENDWFCQGGFGLAD